MATFNSAVLFALIWWVMLFAVLPWGVRPQDHTGNPAQWSGAPERPMMWRKILATTVITVVLWFVAEMAVQGGWINFRPSDTAGYSLSSPSVTGK